MNIFKNCKAFNLKYQIITWLTALYYIQKVVNWQYSKDKYFFWFDEIHFRRIERD